MPSDSLVQKNSWLATDGFDDFAEGMQLIESLSVNNRFEPNNLPITVWNSNNNLVGRFETIQDGVDAAGNGYIIDIAAGTYREQVILNGFTNLTLAGDGNNTVIEMPDFNDGGWGNQDRAAVISILNSENVVVRDLKVDGRGLANQLRNQVDFIGVSFTNSSGSLEHSTVVGARDPLNADGSVSGNQRGNAVLVLNTDGRDRAVSIVNNQLFDYQKNGITAIGPGLTVSINNNIITGNGFINRSDAQAQNGIQVSVGAGGSITNNVISAIGQPRNDFASSYILVSDAEPGIEIIGNEINGTSEPSTTFGLIALGTDDLNVRDNKFDRVLYGVYLLDNFNDPAINRNTFTNIVSSFLPLVGGSNPPEFATEAFTGSSLFVDGSSNTSSLNFVGTDGPDVIIGSSFDDTLSGGAGNDTIVANGGNDVIIGGAGEDTITTGAGQDTIVYEGPWYEERLDLVTDFDVSHDVIDLFAIFDTKNHTSDDVFGAYIRLNEQDGSTTVEINPRGDFRPNFFRPIVVLEGTIGLTEANFIFTADGTNGSGDPDDLDDEDFLVITGDDGKNRLSALDGSNHELLGLGSRDRLVGSTGNDILDGGAGPDNLTGGGGRDSFRYTAVGDGRDSITDFEVGVDQLDLSNLFTGRQYGFTTAQEIFSHYVDLREKSIGTIVRVDAAGDSGDDFQSLALVKGVTNLSIADFTLI